MLEYDDCSPSSLPSHLLVQATENECFHFSRISRIVVVDRGGLFPCQKACSRRWGCCLAPHGSPQTVWVHFAAPASLWSLSRLEPCGLGLRSDSLTAENAAQVSKVRSSSSLSSLLPLIGCLHDLRSARGTGSVQPRGKSWPGAGR